MFISKLQTGAAVVAVLVAVALGAAGVTGVPPAPPPAPTTTTGVGIATEQPTEPETPTPAGGTVDAPAPREAAGPRPVLTPAEVVKRSVRGRFPDRVVVRFRVRSVASSNPEKTYLYADPLMRGDQFAAGLSAGAKTELGRAGVKNLTEHFAGKEVEVKGPVSSVVVWSFPAHTLYMIHVDRADQIRAVRAVEK